MLTRKSKYGFKEHYDSIEQYVDAKTSGISYERGALEVADAAAQNCREVLGRLLNFMVRKGSLAPDDLFRIVEGFANGTLDIRGELNDE